MSVVSSAPGAVQVPPSEYAESVAGAGAGAGGKQTAGEGADDGSAHASPGANNTAHPVDPFAQQGSDSTVRETGRQLVYAELRMAQQKLRFGTRPPRGRRKGAFRGASSGFCGLSRF